MRARLLRTLDSDAAPWVAALLALVFSLPSLPLGLQADDHALSYRSRQGDHPFALFSVTPDELHMLREGGSFAWWSSPHLEIAFLRPLSSLIHTVEFRLWPDAAWAMHLGNVLAYAALVLVAALLYRELLPSRRLAGLAAVMFAIDEAHAPAIGWIASRNTLLAVLFALACVLLHVRSRRQARPALALLSALALTLALLCGEAGVAALPYLVAYALVFEVYPSGTRLNPSGGRGTRSASSAAPGLRLERSWRRLSSIAPQLAVFAAWAAYYIAYGCGLRGSSWYHEFNAPLTLLREGLLDSPIWLLSLFGPSLIGMMAGLAPAVARAVALCLVLPVLVGLWFLLPRSKLNAFFGLSMLLGAPALFATIPQERVTLAASFAAFGWIVSLLSATQDTRVPRVRWYRRATLALHLGFAPLMFVPGLNLSGAIERGIQATLHDLPASLPAQLVFVNLPLELLTVPVNVLLREEPRAVATRSAHQLYAGGSSLTATRTAPDALELRATPGWGQKPIERIFCAERDLPRAGTQREFDGIRFTVLENDAKGAPTRVRFQFATPLEAADRLWFTWQGKGLAPWQPPALGQSVELPAVSMVTAFMPR